MTDGLAISVIGAKKAYKARVGGPKTVAEQIRRCHDECGAGVIDLAFQVPGSGEPRRLMDALELFGTKVLPLIRDI